VRRGTRVGEIPVRCVAEFVILVNFSSTLLLLLRLVFRLYSQRPRRIGGMPNDFDLPES
jgi:hypothetical protein